MNYDEYIAKFNIDLNEQQAVAVRSLTPTALIAVPGSGKTTTIIARLGYMIHCRDVRPQDLLTITYTVAAARDMRSRCAALFGDEQASRIPFKTINALALEIVNYYARNISGREPFALATDTGRLCLQILRRFREDFVGDGDVQELQTMISYVKNEQMDRKAIEKKKIGDLDLAPMYEAYVAEMRRQRLMDYDDQLVYALAALEKYPQVLAHFRKKYPHLLVDEAQDTSHIQHSIIRLLCSGSIFMVGDEDQSIYGFRAADPQALLDFERDYEGGRVLFLETNYRSLPEIVRTAGRFIALNKKRHDKNMEPARSRETILSPANTDGPAQALSAPESRSATAPSSINYVHMGARVRQYEWLVANLADAVRRGQRTAVLYRNNSSAVPLIKGLVEADVGYRCRGTDSSFFSSATVQAVLNLMKLSLDPQNMDLFLMTYYKTRSRLRREEAIAAIDRFRPAHHYSLWQALAEDPGLSRKRCDLIEEIGDTINYLKHQSAADALDALEDHVLSDQGFDNEKLFILRALTEKNESIEDFLFAMEDLADRVAAGSTDPDSPVTLTTIHSSKGLEFDHVIIMDVIDNQLPYKDPMTGHVADREEERRLFYVAMTRARDRLTILKYSYMPSEFIKALEKPSVTGSLPGRRKVQKHPSVPLNLTKGCRVTHPTFGPGTVTDLTASVVTVRFDSDETRKLARALCEANGLLTEIN